ncbi:uncharacterized protein A1O5_00991 [Cladophialophora psammophila CBS 110553]|uniref:Alpha/beta hydrolase fold-3 domain-containing protein n=1 Tax=Cladophialophora psammophila CBS 110553 TaxID=1182543 RepID=W9X8E6_9EURO|nr:uncharacterized protein A1O5_00991 [Cladophialophora psammophila CBS 110553]EXJ76483.1 hypothetical protein A1O5_00991 [Cladophialophora psammophila CBS 110553]
MSSLKYTWLSEADPVWIPLKQACDEQFDGFYALPIEKQHETWVNYPHPVPEGTPMDLEVSFEQVPVRDGAKVGIKIYRNTEKLKAMGKVKAPLVLVAHGGGWVLGNHDVEEGVCRWIAKETGAVVVDVDYRLAPAYRFPYAINDFYDGFKWCKDNATTLGIDPSLIVSNGSSAGANLAAVLPIMAKDHNEEGIVGQVLNGPVVCHPRFFPKDKYEYTSWEQNKKASILGKDHMLRCWDTYYPNTGPDVYANPFLVETMEGLPPALIQITGMDPLRDEAFAYADRLKEAGVPVEVATYPGLPHGFYTFPQLEASTRYFKKAASWIKELLAKKGWES